MVDLETTGTNFERNAIIQIAAVKFDWETGQVCPDFFDRCLHVHPGREWDLDTRMWWQKQGSVLSQIEARAEDPYTVVRAFYDWLLDDFPSDGGRHLWAKPSHFEYPFLSSYFKMFRLDFPLHYRLARDLNSFMAGQLGRAEHPQIPNEPTFNGDEHNALHDVIHQIKLLFAVKDCTTQAVVLP